MSWVATGVVMGEWLCRNPNLQNWWKGLSVSRRHQAALDGIQLPSGYSETSILLNERWHPTKNVILPSPRGKNILQAGRLPYMGPAEELLWSPGEGP